MVILTFACLSHEAKAAQTTGYEEYEVANGVSEAQMYVTDDSKENVCLHILKIDTNADVVIKASSNSYYNSGSTKLERNEYAARWISTGTDKYWGFSDLLAQSEAYEKTNDAVGEVIAASNGDHYQENGISCGNLVLEGNKVHVSDIEPFFAITEDGKYEIRKAGSDLTNIREAIGGSYLLLYDGEITVVKDDIKEPRQAIGITSKGDIVIVNAEGRSMTSAGLELYELAKIMRQQGCVSALNLDGGGSAGLATKRSGEKNLKYRNANSEGFRRKVSTSLLVIRKNDVDDAMVADKANINTMRSSSTLLRETAQGYEYIINGKKQSGFKTVNGKTYYFTEDGCGMNGTIEFGKFKYIFKNGELIGSSDQNAGKILIGYCGQKGAEKNLIYIYHQNSGILNIVKVPGSRGIANMRDWERVVDVPWHNVLYDIREINIYEGVDSIGCNFMVFQDGRALEGSNIPRPKLKQVNIFSADIVNIADTAFTCDDGIHFAVKRQFPTRTEFMKINTTVEDQLFTKILQ